MDEDLFPMFEDLELSVGSPHQFCPFPSTPSSFDQVVVDACAQGEETQDVDWRILDLSSIDFFLKLDEHLSEGSESAHLLSTPSFGSLPPAPFDPSVQNDVALNAVNVMFGEFQKGMAAVASHKRLFEESKKEVLVLAEANIKKVDAAEKTTKKVRRDFGHALAISENERNDALAKLENLKLEIEARATKESDLIESNKALLEKMQSKDDECKKLLTELKSQKAKPSSKANVEKIRAIKDRAITFIKGADKIILSDSQIFVLDNN